jgi:hypothetical protein
MTIDVRPIAEARPNACTRVGHIQDALELSVVCAHTLQAPAAEWNHARLQRPRHTLVQRQAHDYLT